MPELKTTDVYRPTGDQPSAISTLAHALRAGERYSTLVGATGTGKTATMAWTIEEVGKPALVIAHNKTLAAQLCNEFREFFPHNAVEYFVSYYDYYQPEAYVPQADLYIEKDSSRNDDIDRLRHSATSNLLSRRDVIIVASVSCIYGLGSPDEYKERVIFVNVGEEQDRDLMLRKLIDIQYVRNDTLLGRGRFRVQGDVGEVQPAYSATRWRRSRTSIRSRERCCRSTTRSRSSRPRSTLRPSRPSSAQPSRSATSSRSRSRSSSPRGRCSRRTGSGSARSTTSR